MDLHQNKKKLPITVLCGFLGAGKTTLLNYILNQRHDYRIAVIVNDMGEINVDSQIIRQGRFSIKQTKEKLVEMQNGCICCTLRDDLQKQVSKIAKTGKFDYMIIESSGISEPLPIAQAFFFENDELKKKGVSLRKSTRLDCMVTMIDGFNFLNQLQSTEESQEMNVQTKQMAAVPLSQLLLDQIEFANVIIINKMDMISDDQANLIKGLLNKLNPSAKLIQATKSIIDLKEIINTKLFNFEESQNNSKWIEELSKPIHKSEIEEYGISSCVFRAKKPFNSNKLYNLIQRNSQEPDCFWKYIIRCKGSMWLASKDKLQVHIHKAGLQLTYEPAAFWWISIPQRKWGQSEEEIQQIWKDVQRNWLGEPIGDKRQEIIFIGQNLPKEEILREFENCLISDLEMEQYLRNEVIEMEDPFPSSWDKMLQTYEKLGEVRQNDGEWEDVWDSEGEMQEEDEIQ